MTGRPGGCGLTADRTEAGLAGDDYERRCCAESISERPPSCRSAQNCTHVARRIASIAATGTDPSLTGVQVRKLLIIVYAVSSATFLIALSIALMSNDQALTVWANRAQVFSVLIVLLTFVGQSAVWLLSRGQLTGRASTDLRDNLALVMPEDSFTRSGLNEEDVWPVRWNRTSTLASKIGVSGTVLELVESIRQSSSRPLVILGDEGSGKTQLARLACHTSNEGRDAPAKLPVRIYLGSWDRRHADFIDWAAKEVAQMAARSGISVGYSRRTVVRFLQTDKVLLIFDGFDELDESNRVAALSELSRRRLPTFVLLSRPTEFIEAQQNLLIAYDSVLLDSLMPDYAAQKIAEAAGDQAWRTLAEQLRADGVSAASKVLSKPLFLSIVCELAARRTSIPNLVGVADESACEAIVMRTYMEQVHLLKPRSPTPSGEAISLRHLKTVARTIRAGDNENFLWWNLHRVVPWWQIALILAALAFALTLLAGWVLSLIDAEFFGRTSIVDALVVGVLVAAISSSPVSNAGQMLAPKQTAIRVFVIVVCLGELVVAAYAWKTGLFRVPGNILGMTLLTLVVALEIGVVAGFVSAIRIRIARVDSSSWPDWLRSVLRPTDILYGGPPRDLGWSFSITKIVIPSLLVIGAYWALFLPISNAPTSGTRSVGYPIPQPIAGFIVFALASLPPTFVALSLGAVRVRERIWAMVLGNLVFAFLRGTLSGSAAFLSVLALSVALIEGPSATWREFSSGTGYGWLGVVAVITLIVLISAFWFGVAGLVLSSGARFIAAWLRLALVGRLPLRLTTAMETAQELGLLRRSGSGYAFRHPRLRDGIEDAGARTQDELPKTERTGPQRALASEDTDPRAAAKPAP